MMFDKTIMKSFAVSLKLNSMVYQAIDNIIPTSFMIKRLSLSKTHSYKTRWCSLGEIFRQQGIGITSFKFKNVQYGYWKRTPDVLPEAFEEEEEEIQLRADERYIDEQEKQEEEKNMANEENEDDDDDDNNSGGIVRPVIEWIGGLVPRLLSPSA